MRRLHVRRRRRHDHDAAAHRGLHRRRGSRARGEAVLSVSQGAHLFAGDGEGARFPGPPAPAVRALRGRRSARARSLYGRGNFPRRLRSHRRGDPRDGGDGRRRALRGRRHQGGVAGKGELFGGPSGIPAVYPPAGIYGARRAEVDKWRREQSLSLTKKLRPDLLPEDLR